MGNPSLIRTGTLAARGPMHPKASPVGSRRGELKYSYLTLVTYWLMAAFS